MSFALTFFHAPEVATVDGAARWLEQAPRELSEPSTRYAAFVTEVSKFFPDLSDEEDDTGERNLWPEGLNGIPVRDPFVNLAVNLDMLDPGVMSVIAASAARAGLSILDDQNGLLYTPDFRVIGIHDAAPRPLPPVTDVARRLMTQTVGELKLHESQMLIAEAVRKSLGRGFKRIEPQERSIVWREHGELRQMLWLHAMRSTDQKNSRLFVYLAFASTKLTGIYLPLLPESFAARQRKYDRFDGGASMQVRAHLPSIISGDPRTDAVLHSSSDMLFGTIAERDALAGDAARWAKSTLRPFLDEISTVEHLRAWAITDARLAHSAVTRMAYPEYAALLTLARLTSVETLDAYAAAFRRSGGLPKLRELFKEPDDRHFDQLVEGLHGLDLPARG